MYDAICIIYVAEIDEKNNYPVFVLFFFFCIRWSFKQKIIYWICLFISDVTILDKKTERIEEKYPSLYYELSLLSRSIRTQQKIETE